MFGFIIAATSFAGLVFLAATHRRHGFRGRGLYRFLARLDTTPGQEKVIRSAFDELRSATRQTWVSARDARPELAELIRAERLDNAALSAWFEARHQTLRELEERIAGAAGRIHDVLDDRQKRELASWVERGPGFGWHRHHAHC
ncbi:MAG TPA: periplasmic heavy metal sensor [Polyangiaceae bacterium]|nr:periplasmic heavy metal sensor [Polyangiaceae bacterium]